MNIKSVEITRDQNKLVRDMLNSQLASFKNWIVSALESGDYDRANKLVAELRAHEKMCHIFVPDDMWSR